MSKLHRLEAYANGEGEVLKDSSIQEEAVS
jgi:hypothetical protein